MDPLFQAVKKTQKELERVQDFPEIFFPNQIKYQLIPDTVYTGRGKKNSKDHPIQPGIHSFGQDSVWTETWIMCSGTRVVAMMVCDGHGLDGDIASRQILKMLRESIRQDAFLFNLEYFLTTNENLRAEGLLQELFLKAESQFEGTGGTTVSLALVLSFTDHRHFLVTANVGDSPIIVLPPKSTKTWLAYKTHSWENIEERSAYLSYCEENELTPLDVILGRFNTVAGSIIPHQNGFTLPWFMFKEGSSELDHETLEEFHRMVLTKFKDGVGGVQSVRKMVVQDKNGDIKTHPDFTHENWGSTAYDGFVGRTQMTRSIGDIHSKMDLHMRADPSVLIRPLILEEGEEEGVFQIFVCSDGFSDMFYFHEFRELVEKDPDFWMASAKDKIKLLFVEMLKRGKRNKDFGLDCKSNPLWDDCSIIVCSLHLRIIPN